MVIGVVAILAGGLGVALRGFDGRAKVQNAQTTLVGAFNGARAKAAVNQSSVTLLLNADPDDREGYLREIIPVTKDGTAWRVAGESSFLPVGYYIVPPNLGAAFPAKYDAPSVASNWATIKSFASDTNPASATIKVADTTSNDDLRTVHYTFELATFDSLGRFSPSAFPPGLTTTYVISPGEPVPGVGVTFREHEAVRGLWISRYGVTVVVNEKAGFDYKASEYDKR